jgi:hypothetical protein
LLAWLCLQVGCEKRRPPVPADCPAPLARLIRECWRHNAAARPRFAEILARVRKMREVAAADGAAAAAELVAAPSSGWPPRSGPYNVFTPEKAAGIGRDRRFVRLGGGPQSDGVPLEMALRTI